jgi:hypothetical protein
MEVKVTFEEGDFNGMHDVLVSLTGHSYSHEELEQLWRKLPEDIQDEFIRWGGSDTVVRDNMYEYYEEIMKQKGLTHVDDGSR